MLVPDEETSPEELLHHAEPRLPVRRDLTKLVVIPGPVSADPLLLEALAFCSSSTLSSGMLIFLQTLARSTGRFSYGL